MMFIVHASGSSYLTGHVTSILSERHVMEKIYDKLCTIHFNSFSLNAIH